MIAFYKVVEDGFIAGFGTNGGDNATAISKTEYDSLTEMFQNRPTAPAGYAYMIQDNPHEWVLVELPPDPDDDLSGDELVDVLLGGAV